MSEAKTYELVTIKDIFDRVPADRIELCMNEIAQGMAEAKVLFSALDSLAKDLGSEDGAKMKWPDKVAWRDDKKGEITMHCVVNDVPICTIVTAAKEPV